MAEQAPVTGARIGLGRTVLARLPAEGDGLIKADHGPASFATVGETVNQGLS